MTDARIHERGYRRYDGPRLGPWYAVRSLTLHTIQRLLGLKRPARSKILPVLVVVISYLPAIVIIGVRALIPQAGDELVPQYHQYYDFIGAAILLFVSFTAPESICYDRRNKSLSLYLAAPLTRTTYLFAKWLAVVIVLLLVTVGPVLFLMLGLIFQGVGPDGPVGILLATARIVASGVSLAVIFASVSVAVASLTDRRAIASAMTIFGFLALGALAGVITDTLQWDERWLLLSPMISGFTLVPCIFGINPFFDEGAKAGVPLVAGIWLAWTAAAAGFAWWRYQRLQVTR